MTRAGATALLLALALLLPAGARAAEPRASLPDIEDEVMCVECGTALNISQAPSAERQRAFIRRRIAEGKTKDQIKAALVAEYGRAVLGTPSNRGFDAASWIVPVVLALLAVLAVGATARRWRRAGRLGRDPSAEEEPPADDLAPGDARRLERDMAGYDL